MRGICSVMVVGGWMTQLNANFGWMTQLNANLDG